MPSTREGLLAEITRNLQILPETFTKFCLEGSLSQRFLVTVRDLSRDCKKWDLMQRLLERGREDRYAKKLGRVSRAKEWVPWDADRAKEIWEEEKGTFLPGITNNAAVECAGDQKVHIIFCGISRYDDIYTGPSEFISIHIDAAHTSYEGKFLQFFTVDYLADLERKLGRGLVASATPDQHAHFMVHQNVVAMVAAQESGLVSAEFRSMIWLSDMVTTHGFAGHVADISADEVVVFAPWESDQINEDMTKNFYDQIQEATAFHKNLRVYPSRDETYAAGYKLIDIATLARIAEDPTTPENYSYRPRTCLGRGKCTMAEWPKEMVLKQNFSCGSRDVRFVDGRRKASWNVLACTDRKYKSNGTKKSDRTTWLHQEYVTKLKDWGEIRVMMIGGRIEMCSRTQWTRGEKNLYPRKFLLEDFEWFSKDPEEWGKKYQELKGFCEFTYNAIIRSPQAEKHFESLHVGLRMDIGISDDGRFYVNEITRWYEADWFSQQLSDSDPTILAKSIGRSFAKRISGK